MRAVLDSNTLVAAILSPGGTPAELVSRWLTGDFELVVSEELLSELGRALAYPKLRTRVPADDAEQLVARFRLLGSMAPDPPNRLAGRATPATTTCSLLPRVRARS